MKTRFLVLLLIKEIESFRYVSSPLSTARIRQFGKSFNSIQPLSDQRYSTTQLSLIPLDCKDFTSTFPMSSLFQGQTTIFLTIYFLTTNLIYLLRRSHIRNMPKRKLLKIRLTKENNVSIPLYLTNLLTWQLFVHFIFPLLEPISRLFNHVSFYYFYPNANGLGIIFEPLSVQSLPMAKRAKHQIRCDWHRFSVNVGNVGRDGYRHPPSVERNLPHLDVPRLGWKHWPWRRKEKYNFRG